MTRHENTFDFETGDGTHVVEPKPAGFELRTSARITLTRGEFIGFVGKAAKTAAEGAVVQRILRSCGADSAVVTESVTETSSSGKPVKTSELPPANTSVPTKEPTEEIANAETPISPPAETPAATPTRPEFSPGAGGEYTDEQKVLITEGMYQGQEEKLTSWVSDYWGHAENRPFHPESAELHYKYIFDQNDPENAIVLLEAGGDYQGKTFREPMVNGQYLEVPPEVPGEDFTIPEGLGPFEVSGGNHVLANVDGQLARVDGQGNIKEVINQNGQWEKVSTPEDIAESLGFPEDGLFPLERTYSTQEIDGEKYLIDDYNSARMAQYEDGEWKSTEDDSNVRWGHRVSEGSPTIEVCGIFGNEGADRNNQNFSTCKIVGYWTGNWRINPWEDPDSDTIHNETVLEVLIRHQGDVYLFKAGIGSDDVENSGWTTPEYPVASEEVSDVSDIVDRMCPGERVGFRYFYQAPKSASLPGLPANDFYEGIVRGIWLKRKIYYSRKDQTKLFTDAITQGGDFAELGVDIDNFILPSYRVLEIPSSREQCESGG